MSSTVDTAQSRSQSNLRPLWVTLLAISALLCTALLYSDAFAWWWGEWTAPGSFYAHALFVPVFVACMLWRNRQHLSDAPPSSGIRQGALLLVPAVILLCIGKRLDVTFVQSISFMLYMIGAAYLFFGPARMKYLLFPLGFIIMMMPLLPDQIINLIAFPIQMASARLATALLNLVTLHAQQQGTLIQMDNYRMAVELPCSGFKTLISLGTFTAAFAYLVEAETWKRWTLFLATIPLSLFINGLRICFIGIVGELVGTKAASVFHDWSGFIVLTLAFLFLFNFARVLQCRRFLGVPLNEAVEKEEREAAADPDRVRESEWWQVILRYRPSAQDVRRALPILVGFNLFLAAAVSARTLVTRPLHPKPTIGTAQVPMEFSNDGVTWTAPPDPSTDKLTKDVMETLSPMRVISRNYGGSDGSHINLFITAGNGRKTFHDAHSCSLGANAVLMDVGVVDIPTRAGTVRLQESNYKRSDSTEVYKVFIGYVVEGKVLQAAGPTRDAILRQMIYGDSGTPSYFFRVVQLVPGDDAQRRQETVSFIQGIWGQIGPILTNKVAGDANEGPPGVMPDQPVPAQ